MIAKETIQQHYFLSHKISETLFCTTSRYIITFRYSLSILNEGTYG